MQSIIVTILRIFQLIIICVVILAISQLYLIMDSSATSTSNISGKHIRSPLLRTMYKRMAEDDEKRNEDHSYWYAVNTSSMKEDIASRLVLSDEDSETKAFLDMSYDKSDWVFTQIYHLVAKSILSWFMTNTSINGLLQRGSMFVLSDQQFCKLMNVQKDWKSDKLLDLGAGDGKVTQVFSSHFTHVDATETSTPMQWRLQEKGYNILGIDEWIDNREQYDVVSALNLLDRCDKPMTLLRQIHKVLKPETGRLLIAVVLPFKQYVEFGRDDHAPSEKLNIESSIFEEQVCDLVKEVFEPSGYRLESFTRVPYLCEGDLEHSFYSLDDAVFLLKPVL